jgi:very-short-patch-repair endonuclease
MSDFDQFLAIRKAYKKVMPQWLDEYEKTGEMRHDPYFMDWVFTPIEQAVWSDIRTIGIPFYPQVPVLNYFLDFANPFLKIGIECDGKAWHDHDLDKARDARLAAAGWTIFRIEGHECKRVVEPWSEIADEQDDSLVYQFFLTTSEGILSAIKQTYFMDEPSPYLDKYRYYIDSTLFEHRSTPLIDIRRKKPTGGNPDLRMIGDYVERLCQELIDKARAA